MRVQSIIDFTNFTSSNVNVVYYNDLHGQTGNIDAFLAKRQEFYKNNPEAVNLTLSGGDVFVDSNKGNEKIANSLISNTDAVALGNHDLEGGIDYLKGLIKRTKTGGKYLSANLDINLPDSEPKLYSPSKIIERNGEKIGVIGVSPFDFKKLSHNRKETENIRIKDFYETERIVRQEVKALEEQGINKIFLLAHTGLASQDGLEYYNEFAKIGGIDVIIGGHDHKEFDYELMSERGEPVRIVSTGAAEGRPFGENLDCFGELELEFDDNGVITNSKNRIVKILKGMQDNSKKVSENVVYTFQGDVLPKNLETGHNETGNIVADACLEYARRHSDTVPDFAFVNSGTVRADFSNKEVVKENIESVVPFTTNLLMQAPLTKKQIMDTLNWCAESTSLEKVSPGLMYVSGLEYTVDKNLTVKDVHILNEDGTVKYFLDDFNDEDSFNVVYDIFLATGVAGLSSLIKDVENDPEVEQFYVPRQTALLDYLSGLGEKKIKDFKTPRIHLVK